MQMFFLSWRTIKGYSVLDQYGPVFTEFSTGARLAAVSDLGGNACQDWIPREIPDHLHHKRFNQSAPGPFEALALHPSSTATQLRGVNWRTAAGVVKHRGLDWAGRDFNHCTFKTHFSFHGQLWNQFLHHVGVPRGLVLEYLLNIHGSSCPDWENRWKKKKCSVERLDEAQLNLSLTQKHADEGLVFFTSCYTDVVLTTSKNSGYRSGIYQKCLFF